MHLSSVLKGETDKEKERINKLFTIMALASNTSASELTVGSLKNFDLNIVPLSKIIDKDSTDVSGNSMLKQLLADSTVTAGNIGEKINGLKLEDVFQTNVFELAPEGSTKAKYRLDNGSYYLDEENGTYQLSTAGGTWLTLLYNFNPTQSEQYEDIFDVHGNVRVFLNKRETVGGISEAVVHEGEELFALTLRVFKDIGVVKGDYEEFVLRMTVEGILNLLNDQFSQ